MKILANIPGTGAPDADYLKGKIVDKQTKVSVDINSDIVEFFQKLISIANISENDLPDNETNGHQLLEALADYLKENGSWTEVDSEYNAAAPFPQANYVQPDTRNLKYRKTKSDYLEILGSFITINNPTSGDLIFTLPASFRPPIDSYMVLKGGLGTEPIDIKIQAADGRVEFAQTLAFTTEFIFNDRVPMKE